MAWLGLLNTLVLFLSHRSKLCKMSECIDDMCAYTKLIDNIYHRVLHSTEPELREAREILEKIEHRQLYKCIGQTKPMNHDALPIHVVSICWVAEQITNPEAQG
jgi:hypothetical protein